ncbi:MAG: hypothetical protein QMD85_01705 [Candidatus Aenigmarchaeota archaeon]|nr:hypothetical protein [Candidatus Aenigmarchaeota archaeon]MDI6722268.1 hypothetical protein [Candidatus Aenigmarchaeota archaeon]
MNFYKKAAINVVNNIERYQDEKILIVAEDSVPMKFPLEILGNFDDPSASVMVFKDSGKANIEPPPQVAKAMKECDILIQCISNINLYTKAYLDAYNAKTKILTMYGLDDYVIENFIAHDDKESKIKTEDVGKSMEDAGNIRIVSGNGTDLSMKLCKRPVLIDDGYLKHDEIKGDLMPGYVISVAPLEESINGILVVDWSINPPLNIIETPVKILFMDGKIESIEGGDESKKFISWINSLEDKKIFFISHLSIGTNVSIKNFTGKYLLDERKDGAVTIGLGNNLGPYGGKNDSPNHCDLILKNASVTADGKVISGKNAK